MVNKDNLSVISRLYSYLLILIISGVLLVIFTFLLILLYNTILVTYSNPQNNYFNDSYILIGLNYLWIIVTGGTFIVALIFYLSNRKSYKGLVFGNDEVTRECIKLTKIYAIIRVFGFYIALGAIVPIIVSIMYYVNGSAFNAGTPDYRMPALYSLFAFLVAAIIASALFLTNFFINKKLKVLYETPLPPEDNLLDEEDSEANLN